MQFVRPAIASDPRTFGHRIPRVLAGAAVRQGASGDLKLFATTFFVGFMFVSVLLA